MATFRKVKDSETLSTISNVEIFPAIEGIAMKAREAFSKWTALIG